MSNQVDIIAWRNRILLMILFAVFFLVGFIKFIILQVVIYAR